MTELHQQGDEARRLALQALNIMDTPAEPRFDRFTRLAARLCNADYGAVTLLDGERQWFKSCFGFDIAETPQRDSFCRYAVDHAKLMEVSDTYRDPRFADNPLVVGEPGIRFYAGFPIHAPDGTGVGTLCVFSQEPGILSPEQRKDLVELARLVERELVMDDMTTALAEQHQKAAEFQMLKREAELASEAKSRFLTRMSHEIRTPMNGVLGMLQLLDGTPLNDEQHRLVKVARTSGDLLLTLINDILDLSRIEAGKFTFQDVPFSLRTLLEQMDDLMQPLATRKGLRLTTELPESVPDLLRGDPQRLHQILINLVSNAVKYTREGTVKVTVDGEGTAEGDTRLRFRVADTGGGIPEADQQRIFHAFTQLDNAIGVEEAGTGLGLSITRRLVENMGGVIDVSSRVGEGSVFTVSLAFALAPEALVAQQDEVPVDRDDPPREQSILVAEDDAVSRMVAVSFLEREGHQVTALDNGHDALEALVSQRFDLALLDFEMPGLSGGEVAEALRREEERRGLPRTPVVAATAHMMTGDRERVMATGMDDFLGKPIQHEELRRAIQRHCRGRTPGSSAPDHAGAEPPLTPSADDLLTRLGGDRGLALNLLDTLAGSLAAHEQQLRQAWSREESDTLRSQAHTLKGMFANMGMDVAAARCADLEAALRADGGHNDTPAVYERLLATVSAARPAVEELMQQLRD